MISLLLKRFIHGLIVLWAVATLTFTLLRLAPGGPFDSERKLPPEILANLEAKYHLNEPLIEQYLRYLAGIARGDLGPSYKYLDRGVTEIIGLCGYYTMVSMTLNTFEFGLPTGEVSDLA